MKTVKRFWGISTFYIAFLELINCQKNIALKERLETLYCVLFMRNYKKFAERTKIVIVGHINSTHIYTHTHTHTHMHTHTHTHTHRHTHTLLRIIPFTLQDCNTWVLKYVICTYIYIYICIYYIYIYIMYIYMSVKPVCVYVAKTTNKQKTQSFFDKFSYHFNT